MSQLGALEAHLAEVEDAMREAARDNGSRELSLAITNLQQSKHWLREAIATPSRPKH